MSAGIVVKVAFCLGALFMAGFFSKTMFGTVSDGYIVNKYGTRVDRDFEPGAFWFYVAMFGFMAIFCLIVCAFCVAAIYLGLSGK